LEHGSSDFLTGQDLRGGREDDGGGEGLPVVEGGKRKAILCLGTAASEKEPNRDEPKGRLQGPQRPGRKKGTESSSATGNYACVTGYKGTNKKSCRITEEEDREGSINGARKPRKEGGGG